MRELSEEERKAIAQSVGASVDNAQYEEFTDDEILWHDLLTTYRKLKAQKPDDRSEKARRYAVTITEYEKMMGYFYAWIIDELKG